MIKEFVMVASLLAQFQVDFNRKPSTQVAFVDEPLTSHARCNYNPRLILVNINHWRTLPYVHKRELLYHELGHCEFNLSHEPYDKPSIMRPRVYSTKKDGSNWQKLLDYMKRKVKKK